MPIPESEGSQLKGQHVEYPSDDNWRHRSAQMKCQTCMWYVAKRAALGRCRRRSPTMSGFPAVFESDWCGDHKLNEEAL